MKARVSKSGDVWTVRLGRITRYWSTWRLALDDAWHLLGLRHSNPLVGGQ